MVLLVAVGGREATEHVRKTKASKIDSRSSAIAASGAWLLGSLLVCVCSSTRQPLSLWSSPSIFGVCSCHWVPVISLLSIRWRPSHHNQSSWYLVVSQAIRIYNSQWFEVVIQATASVTVRYRTGDASGPGSKFQMCWRLGLLFFYEYHGWLDKKKSMATRWISCLLVQMVLFFFLRWSDECVGTLAFINRLIPILCHGRSKKEGVWASFWASGQGYGTSRWLIIVNQFILCIKNAISWQPSLAECEKLKKHSGLRVWFVLQVLTQ